MPEVNSRGKTIEQLQDNLINALHLVIESQRNKTIRLYEGKNIIGRKLNLVG
jgi:predicted RNase H-like HicB family nuclease